MERDYRRLLTPEQLYTAGLRISASYTVDEAVRDYLRIHPNANLNEVQGQIERAVAATA